MHLLIGDGLRVLLVQIDSVINDPRRSLIGIPVLTVLTAALARGYLE